MSRMAMRQQACLASLWAVIVGVTLATPQPAEAQGPDSIFFHDDYDKAIQEAKLTKKPVFLEFRCAP